MEKENRKRKFLIPVIAVLILALAGAGYYLYHRFAGGSGGETVYVMPVSDGSGLGAGGTDRYMGVVEAQSTVEIQVDTSKTVKEIYVAVGDEVQAGDLLFSYDSDAIVLEIDQLKLDIQRLESTISSNYTEIQDLRQQQASAPADMQLEYSLNIQTLQNEISSCQYSIKSKQNELASKRASLENTDVAAKVSGTVTAVPSKGDSTDYMEGQNSNSFKIMESGEYLIKCTISELNLQMISQGAPVVIESRVDDKQWSGTIKSIDTSNTAGANTDEMGPVMEGGGESASKYYFYVSPDNSEGLFLGRHVIVSLGGAKKAAGLYISGFFVCDAETDPYVWKDENGKLVKQPVTLGEFDEELYEYRIASGLEATDYIAYPDETLREGMKTARSFDFETGE